ncbi:MULTISPECIES: DUF6415 family natural product biosynthesis protein [Streptomyces]|uniref:DUF6415 family natural product biosynthesis protein n=1 Tax=Streptomyces TaxID=1883 RepID=UPI000B9E4EAA|nr:hypothetical protein [Streptomyces kasugaensis]
MTPSALAVLSAPGGVPESGSRFSNDVGTQTRVLAKLREHALEGSKEIPVLDELFEDLEAVLGECADLGEDDVERLRPRVHASLRRVLGAAEKANLAIPTATVKRGRDLLSDPLLADLRPVRGHLRHLATVTAELLDWLLEDMP